MRIQYRKRQFGYASIRLLLLVILVMLAACASPQPTSSPLTSPLTSPLVPDAVTEAPVSVVTASVPFQIDKPLVSGMNEITGRGPAGIPVLLADVTMGGEIIGNGAIDRNGKFVIRLGAPLEKAHRIGLTLGDFTGTGRQHEEFFDQQFYGDEAFLVPQVGFFFDTAMVGD